MKDEKNKLLDIFANKAKLTQSILDERPPK